MMLLNTLFYKRFGIRKQELLVSPLLHSINTLCLPMNAIYHYLGNEDGSAIGMTIEDPILQGYVSRYVLNQFVLEYGDAEPLGKPMLQPVAINTEIRKYFQKNLRFRPIKDYRMGSKDPKVLTVMNYAAIERRYRYQNNPFANYWRWVNIQKTLWLTIADVAANTDRQQYVIIDIPELLPPPSVLMKYEKTAISQDMIKNRLPSAAHLNVADLWCWLGDDRSKSLMSVIPDEALQKVNLIFVEMGRWTTLNLGILNSWKKQEIIDEETRKTNVASVKGLFSEGQGLTSLQLQRRLLRGFMGMNEASKSVATLEESDIEEEATTVESERDENGELIFNPTTNTETVEKPDLYTDDDESEPPPDIPEPIIDEPAERSRKGIAGKHTDNPESEFPDVADTDDIVFNVESDSNISEQDLEKDLEQLEKIAIANANPLEVLSYKPYTAQALDLESGIMNKADEMVKKGVISAAQYRRFEQLATRYKTLPDPYGDRTKKLETLLTIPTSDLMVSETPLMDKRPKGVDDNSYMKSSLQQMGPDYIRKVMKKDMTKMVMSLQKGAVAIQDYSIEHVEDLNDSYDIHTVRVQPVIGTASTIRFKLPTVNADGSMTAAGTRYSLRSQRGDMPIRKVSPSEVAMTSYYSKLFVTRSERMVFNYPAWLLNQLMSRAISSEDTTVTNVHLGDAFDNTAKTPRVYSILATKLSGFTSGEYTFFFDYNKRIDYFGESVVKTIESKGGLIPVGKADNGDYLIMDAHSTIHRLVESEGKRTAKLVGTIEDILKFDKTKRPIEIAEVGLFAKAIPVGLILAYEAGLGDLMKTLNVEPRREQTRSHFSVGDDEFDVRFADEVLIFKRTPLNMLVFGGFNRYHRDIKRYSVYAFDKKDIYGVVLENNGMGNRFIREMDLMFKMWVDHITEELLVEMNEPTDLFNLFLSAVKKLELDDHPDPMDNLYMRDKGFERFSGIMYGELVKAMRVYSAKPANARATVDINPHAVWHAVMGDATITPIEDSNPIANLQQKEVVVYRGAGGRGDRSMVAKHRMYHRSGIGLVAESNVDNGDVATVTYTTADPNYKSLRGTIRPLEKIEGKAAKVASTTFLLSPGAELDDPKRINTVPCYCEVV